MSISFIISVGLDVYKPRMPGFRTKTIFMLNYICVVQEDKAIILHSSSVILYLMKK